MRKRYDASATPCQRLLADSNTAEQVWAKLKTLWARLDPVALLHEIRHRQRRLVAIADKAGWEEGESGAPDNFVAVLRRA